MERRSALHASYEAAGAKFASHQGCVIPEMFTSVAEECAAVRRAAGVLDWSARGFLVATGSDHREFLHRMVSNDVRGLEPGQGNYSTLLNVQGHLVADLYLWRMDDHILLETHATVKDTLRETLERYVFADDVAVEDQSDRLTALAVEGPAAAALLEAAGAQTLPGKEFNHTWIRLADGTPVHVAAVSQTGGLGYELIFVVEYAQNVWDTLVAAQARVPWKPVGWAAWNVLRVEAGIPWYGVDILEATLPPEAGLEVRAISFTKGCYIGQEIIERIRSRGHVNRKLTGLLVEGEGVPAAGTKLLANSREVGEITTAVRSPTLGRVIALGYVRREHLTPATRLQLAGGAAAEVASLPFLRTR
ncbi:MAG: aminomethyl transferase family protein [Acidobacteria bacterium]|nr:aminomethyl transferase family protein [Acidobacteriota bacterium]